MGRPRNDDKPDPRFEPVADYDLDDWLEFDFDEYFDAVLGGRKPFGTSEEHTHMVLRCFAIHGDASPVYVREEVRRRLENVLAGDAWRFAFPLLGRPGPTLKEIMPRSTLDLAHLGAAVVKLLREDDTLKIGAAQERVSEETGEDLRKVQRGWKYIRDELKIPPGKRPAKNP